MELAHKGLGASNLEELITLYQTLFMNKPYFPWVLLLFCYFWSPTAVANFDIYGSELSWQCDGQGNYVFTAVVYSDCSDNLLIQNHFLIGPNNNYTMQVDTANSFDIQSTCNNSCQQKMWRIKSDPITLSGTPPASGWDFVYQRCCRDSAQNLGPGAYQGNVHMKTTMYPYTPPGAGAPLSADQCYNSSPRFSQKQLMINCEGPYQYHSAPIDRDFDSLRISFDTCATTFLNLAASSVGYSVNAPFPDASENPLNGAVSIDPQLGMLSVEFYDAEPGHYYAVLLAKEYRRGQLISEVRRELSLLIPDSVVCAPQSTVNNTQPSINLSSNNALSLNATGSVYRTTMMSGDTIDIDISTIDFDFNPNGNAQIICFNAVSSQINSSNYSLDTGCASPSCATIVPINSTSYCGTFAQIYNFKWVPDCRMINNQALSPLTYVFHLQVSDNGCPSPKFNQATLWVDLYPGPLFAPSLQVDAADTNGNVDLSWSKVQISPTSPFDRYVIYSRPLNPAGGVFMPLDSIYDIDSLSASYQNLPYPSEFFIKAFAGTCRYGSPTSSVVSSTVSISLPEHLLAGLAFSISPNPVEEELHISLQGQGHLNKPLDLKVYSLSGALLKNVSLAKGRREWSLPLQLKSGLYIVELSDERRSLRQKIRVL